MSERTCIRVIISGTVQGVGFRWRTREVALSLGIVGWIANRPDGSVEAVFQGSRSAVDEMIRWTRTGPPGAKVDGLEIHLHDIDAEIREFYILR
ncbi:MAG: acylphosphatase [Thermovirga sp.]